jgi:thymidylate kinase
MERRRSVPEYTRAVRIAFSGSHRVGKSTLVESVADILPRYSTVEEPYYLLAEEGYECSETPSLEDFEAQLERSLVAVEEGEQNVLFDRCPADIYAYVLTHGDADAFDADDWLERTRAAMQTIDFVVFVPIEESDRIALPSHEDGEYRLAVHEKLHHLLVDGALGFGTEVLTVHGDVRARVDQVMARIADRGMLRPKRKT